MTLPAMGNSSAYHSRRELKRLLDQFEAAWQSQTPPRIEEFLPAVSTAAKTENAPFIRQLLEELVKIDLDYRRRHPAPGKPWALEDYVRRYPELGPLDKLPVDLIAEEYEVRQHYGERPSHGEYTARFVHHGAKLRETLGRIDAKLAAEFGGKGSAVHDIRQALPVQARQALSSSAGVQPMGQPITSVNTLIDALRQLQLLKRDQLNELLVGELQGRFSDSRAMGSELLRRDWLTPYQVNQLLQGRGQDLVLGDYLLLERLGEGGAGQVFKARQQLMDRIVALKLIRKQLLEDPEVVARFQREIKVIGQLTDPHVVQAFDARAIGSNFFLVMEFVEGIDLARLVKKLGPLPVEQACAYISQAALGLAHIHERGLIHRDIKPSNLILTAKDSRIKILDLGLARLQRSVAAEAADAVTASGAVLVGTLDYMAPEQALDFHQVDIRADIYSLGCTFYYLLAGQAPFAGRTVPQKMVCHQQQEPAALEGFRRDLPAGLSALVRKMMAKRPENRYQTPAEIVQALSQIQPPCAVLIDQPNPTAPAAVLLPAVLPPRNVVVAAEDRALPVPYRAQERPLWPARIVYLLRRLPGGVAAVIPNRRRGGLRGLTARCPRPLRSRRVALVLATVLVLAVLVIMLLPRKAAKEVYLSDMKVEKFQGWGISALGTQGHSDDTQDHSFTAGGKLYAHGLGAKVYARDPRAQPAPVVKVHYKLDGKFRLFRTGVAITDQTAQNLDPSPMRFEVWGDNHVLWETRLGKGRRMDWTGDVDVRGVRELVLSMSMQRGAEGTPAGDVLIGIAWLDPVLIE
jgi:serine/threonine protein kinase